MNFEELSGKTKQEIIDSIELEDNTYLIKFKEVKGGLFKGSSYKGYLYKIEDICTEIKNYLKTVLDNMNIKEVKFESKIREGQINIKLFSANNAILIGKNGQTLIALQNLIKQFVFNKIEMYPYVILDVENYKDKQKKHLEILARKLAREVKKTGNSISMDSMNSYERRIVHNVLTDISGVTSKSEGEEPNRHIVISKC